MEQIHKWRVVIIMAHDGETYFEYNDLEQSILDQSKFDHLSYIIFYYNQKYNTISIKRATIEAKKRYLQELPETEKFVGSDFYESVTLIRFLKFVKEMEKQEEQIDQKETVFHYFVITWGHGGGLFYLPVGTIENEVNGIGLNPQEKSVLIDTVNNSIDENLLAYTQMASGISFRNNNGFQVASLPFLATDLFQQTAHFVNNEPSEGLLAKLNDINMNIAGSLKYYTATDLNTIFKEGLKKVDVYFALSCFTQMLETGYELRHSVNLMVASQTTMPLTGINYSEVFAALEETPDISLTALSDIITRSYKRKYTPEFVADFKSHYPAFGLPIVSFACNFLKEYPLLIDSLNELTELIKHIYATPELKLFKLNISKARNACGDLTPENNYGIIDLNNFLIQLQAQLPNEFNAYIRSIKKEFEIVRSHVLGAIKIPDAPEAAPGMPRNNPLFLSFFAPAFKRSDMINFLRRMYASMDNEYARNSKWAKFADDFYKLTPQS